MQTVTIENWIISLPFEESKQLLHFNSDAITNKFLAGYRKSVYFVSMPNPTTQRTV